MIIKKIFNNNALLAEDEKQNEVILMGRGIAFQKKNGDPLDETKIEKRFVFDASELNDKFEKLFETVPVKYLELSSFIIEMAQKELQVQLDNSIYIGLTDHISYAISRYEEGQTLRNVLLWEIKKFHPAEFKVALKALEMIEYETKIKMEEDEAGFIAMHFVNAQHSGEEMNKTIVVTKMVQDILQIVEYHYQLKLDEDSLSYMRFVTHIRYFARRLFTDTIISEEDDILFEQVKARSPEAYKCAVKVRNYINEFYNKDLTQDEMIYFMLHINRVCSRQITK